MKIVITGVKGQVGTDLLLEAEKRGYKVYGLTSSELDITNKSAVEAMLCSTKPDVIINAAAYTAVDKAESEADKAYAVNELGVNNLADACKASNTPLLHLSTDFVFDGKKKAPYVETDTPNPIGVYGASKLAGEVALQKIWGKHIILRVSWVFGEHGNNFVKTMLRLANDRDEVSVVNDQYGAPTSAKAIAKCLLDIVGKSDFGKQSFPWGIYHFQSDPGVTWHAFAKEVFIQAKESGVMEKKMIVNPIKSEQFPSLVKRPANSKLDGTKIRQNLGVPLSGWKLFYLKECLLSN